MSKTNPKERVTLRVRDQIKLPDGGQYTQNNSFKVTKQAYNTVTNQCINTVRLVKFHFTKIDFVREYEEFP